MAHSFSRGKKVCLLARKLASKRIPLPEPNKQETTRKRSDFCHLNRNMAKHAGRIFFIMILGCQKSLLVI